MGAASLQASQMVITATDGSQLTLPINPGLTQKTDNPKLVNKQLTATLSALAINYINTHSISRINLQPNTQLAFNINPADSLFMHKQLPLNSNK